MKRLFLTTGLVGLAVAAIVAPVSASSPHQVDPATVKPTLNPDFAPWNCFESGQGITCQGSFQPAYENEPIGLQCDGQDAYISGEGRESVTRWHTADGLATKTIAHIDYPGDTFSLSPTGAGPSVTVRGHFNRHYDYLVPGDRASRVMTEVGAIYLVNLPGQGIVVHDTGPVTFAPGQEFEVITSQHGVHDVYDDPSAFEAVICDALTS